MQRAALWMVLSILALAVPAQARGGGHSSVSHTRSHASSSSKSSTRSTSKGASTSSSKASGATSSSTEHVKGYTKKNGTVVAPHDKTRADGNAANNWSTKGNVNPETGKAGHKNATP